MHNTEDKEWWCEYGLEREQRFVEKIAPRLKLAAAINPEKAYNPFAPDLVVNGRLADLKAASTPFFTARQVFGIDPQFAYTFNKKDYERYKQFYPDIDIFVWIHWNQFQWRHIEIRPMVGVYRMPFREIAAHIEAGRVRLHQYKRRTADTAGNARDSYGFDIRTFEMLIQKFLIPQ